MRRADIGDFSEWHRTVADASPEVLATGGSCIAGPDGEWLVAPSQGEEKLLTATIDLRRVFEERQNFDVSGQGTGGFESTPAFSAILIAKHPKFSRPVPTQPMETQQPRPPIINRLNRLFARYGRPDQPINVLDSLDICSDNTHLSSRYRRPWQLHESQQLITQ
jgi:hypothetical protein